jgi:hypothetical protein
MMVVQSRPADPSLEEAFNTWYRDTHLPEIAAVPGVTGTRRYRVVDPDPDAPPTYLAVYDVEADDVMDAVRAIRNRPKTHDPVMREVLQMDPPPVITIYEELD